MIERRLSLEKNAQTKDDLFARLAVRRCGGSADSCMTTIGLTALVQPQTAYQLLSRRGLSAVPSTPKPSMPTPAPEGPPAGLAYTSFDGAWDFKVSAKDDSNILGGNSRLFINSPDGELSVPVMEARQEFLSYYGALLIEPGRPFYFQTKREFPIFSMHIGEHYVDEYLMKNGGGFYLEYHDEPHYHEPLDDKSGGALLLARRINRAADLAGAAQRYHITAFKIALGTAIYTCPYALHDDAALTGPWRVGYIDAAHFSTACMMTEAGAPIALRLLLPS